MCPVRWAIFLSKRITVAKMLRILLILFLLASSLNAGEQNVAIFEKVEFLKSNREYCEWLDFVESDEYFQDICYVGYGREKYYAIETKKEYSVLLTDDEDTKTLRIPLNRFYHHDLYERLSNRNIRVTTYDIKLKRSRATYYKVSGMELIYMDKKMLSTLVVYYKEKASK